MYNAAITIVVVAAVAEVRGAVVRRGNIVVAIAVTAAAAATTITATMVPILVFFKQHAHSRIPTVERLNGPSMSMSHRNVQPHVSIKWQR